MRRCLVGLLALGGALLSGCTRLATEPTNPSGFVIHRGTNISHWLSQDFGFAPRASYFTENDVRFIAHCGFDHIRLPVDEKELWKSDGKPNDAAFALVIQAIGWSRAHGLRVIVDLHIVNAHTFDTSAEGSSNTLWTDRNAQEHFLELWRDLSARLREQPLDAVAYEIMNEPVADNHEDWNRLAAKTLQLIRSLEPQRVVIIDSNRWASSTTMPFLSVPRGDKNIILSTHCYSPLLFTHFRAGWMPIKVYTGPVHYPGPVIGPTEYDQLMGTRDPAIINLMKDAMATWNATRIQEELAPAIQRARELGLQLYCGEFGCLPSVPRADRLAYYRDVTAVFTANNIAWANWEYKGDFGIFEWHSTAYQGGAPDVELIEILLNRAKNAGAVP